MIFFCVMGVTKLCLCVCNLLQDVLYTICNNCGPVQRIVIFRKNGVQAMVEYPLLWALSHMAITNLWISSKMRNNQSAFIHLFLCLMVVMTCLLSLTLRLHLTLCKVPNVLRHLSTEPISTLVAAH